MNLVDCTRISHASARRFVLAHAIYQFPERMSQVASTGGVILNISSNVSRLHLPGLSAYASSKAALNRLSETAREELASENIRVITVYPGLTLTDFSKHSLGKQQVRRNPPAGITPDTPEFVAQKILEAARKEPAEQLMRA